jgi:UPF0176 protein
MRGILLAEKIKLFSFTMSLGLAEESKFEFLRQIPYRHAMTHSVVALYRFVSLDRLSALQTEIKAICLENAVCGTILIAPEGINGTIAAPDSARLENVMDFLDAKTGIRQGEIKYSTASEKPFQRMKVRLKREIVTLKAPEADPNKQVGRYVDPQDWNALLSDPDVILLDTRNIYETEIGIFKNAIDPKIETFTQFKDFVQGNLDPAKHKKIAMFCTGGIRCEKASSYMLAHGFDEVYHLKGGILKYLETVKPEESLWQGGCFVFDERIAIGHGLREEEFDEAMIAASPELQKRRAARELKAL